MTQTQTPALDLSTLPPEALRVLAALVCAVDDATAGDFGFMDEALAGLSGADGAYNHHRFAGHVRHLGVYIAWTCDLSEEPSLHSDTVQYMVTDAVWDAREAIYAAAAI